MRTWRFPGEDALPQSLDCHVVMDRGPASRPLRPLCSSSLGVRCVPKDGSLGTLLSRCRPREFFITAVTFQGAGPAFVGGGVGVCKIHRHDCLVIASGLLLLGVSVGLRPRGLCKKPCAGNGTRVARRRKADRAGRENPRGGRERIARTRARRAPRAARPDGSRRISGGGLPRPVPGRGLKDAAARRESEGRENRPALFLL